MNEVEEEVTAADRRFLWNRSFVEAERGTQLGNARVSGPAVPLEPPLR